MGGLFNGRVGIGFLSFSVLYDDSMMLCSQFNHRNLERVSLV
jgi:hypothetical protein